MTNSNDADEITFAVAAVGREGSWDVKELQSDSLKSLDELVKELRGLRAEGALVCFVCMDDDWSAIVRPVPGGARLLLSDATAALDYYLANDILDELGVDSPSEEEVEECDEPWPEGDFELLEDLGASEQVLTVIFDDEELYASEQVMRVAEELGFAEQLADEVGLELDY
ncbi:hypothetical protein F7230_04690 [Corynebacterium sp. 320]|uniref:tRNA adenosine deaminase-associated protein n=1 Tax=Corynebacterium zhongnanshanii TaxID=2768834 RepID=A0ABQ6VG33_9CORY|nr:MULTISPECIES: tRNA adenosine deaminase-associated protein [Corynebacterium]KAB1504376.1 hypothetical protein F7230_04690 [Corynebacterium sp. 320]KAB1552525.1 hypothetical protein F7233_01910 [Corynebacterium sp. 321]KAB1554261.1 hypothetical protein F7232_04690 [Corynebacterium sp. 319]KAB3522768.1 hypothetical protein F8377_00920 [Corynebacterium zhongnanshanii]KAB3528512.1 hypothetical protein F8354_04690 [Corynebacterium sp. 250]